MPFPSNHTFSTSSRYKIEHFGNEVLLYSASDTNAVYLNETAFLVYKLCSKGQTVEQLIALLESAYPESSPSIRQDVLTTVEELVEKGVLVVNVLE